MNGGEVVFHFKGDTKDIEKKTTTISDIIKGSLITKAITKGIQTVNASLDGAIKRVDILNNFPNVMANLGIGAQESTKAINLLSDKLTGLPTTLESAASAVQRFTSKNGDVEKSSKIFLAVNNAILAGGASMEIQSSALEQLSQSYSKGVMDMVEWRSLQTAMPAQLKQVASAMGMSTDALGELLRDSKTAPKVFDEFIDTIMRLNTEGSNGFASFEQQARASTGGIQTSMTNLKTAVTRGVGNVINAINEALASNNLPTISEMIQNSITKINSAFKTVSEAIKNVDLAKLIDTFNKLKPVIIAVASAFGIFKTALAIQGTITGLIGSFTKLTAVMSANPILLIVSAIAGLVAGFIYLWNTSESFRNFWLGLWNGIKTVFENVVNGISTGINNVIKFFTETIPTGISNGINQVKTFILNGINGIITFFTTTIPTFIASVIGFIAKLPYYIGYAIGYVAGLIANGIMAIYEFFTVKIPEIIANIINWIAQLPGKIWEFITNIADNVSQGLSNIWEGIKTTISNIWEFITVRIPEIIDNIVNWIAQLPGRIWTWLVNTLTKFGTWLGNMKTKAIDGIKKVGENIVNGFKELPNKIKDIGLNIVKGLWNGIKGAGNWIKDKIKDFGKGIMDGFKKTFGIHSPSKEFAIIGNYNMLGLEKGMEDMQPEIQKTIDGMFDLSPSLYGSTSNNLSPQVNVTVNNNMETDPLGQMVNQIKTFAGGSKNDYNYGQGV